MPWLAIRLIAGTMLFGIAKAETIPASQAKEIATDAYLYAYPLLYNYTTLFHSRQSARHSPRYVHRHYSRGFTPADKAIVTPSNDTPYSWAGLDLREEPMVVSVPASPERYCAPQGCCEGRLRHRYRLRCACG